jgi:two-component system, LytTR family, sensor kinase
MAPDRTRKRIAWHALLWVLVWLYIRYANYEVYVPDTDQILNMLSGVDFVQTMGLFYLFGYVVFPRYLYQLRLGPLLVIALMAYYGIYLTTYVVAYYLHGISRSNAQKTMYYTNRGWALLSQAGLLGCFTNSMAALLGIANMTIYVIPLLIPKLIKDLLAYRAQVLLLEQNKLKLELNNLALERHNLRLELDLLKAQVNPHFLFNALNGIYGRVVDADEPAAELVLRLSELMRYNLYEANVPRIALADEVAYVNNYLSLERIRHASLVEVIFSADNDLDGYRIAPMILIAVVEKAVTHSLEAKSARAYVLVETQLDGGTFFMTVQSSTGPHQSASAGQPPADTGLSAIEKRLVSLYPNRHRLDISQTPTRHTVSLQLDLDPQA